MSARTILAPLFILALAVLLIASSSPVAADEGRSLKTKLTGAAEAPTPGDPDGKGKAKVVLNSDDQTVCFDIKVKKVAPITAAHIHIAPVGVAGPVVVSFNVPVNGLEGCVGGVSPTLINAIRQNPSAYYVNVHNADFPGGALRGQLGREDDDD
ncbi:MAG: CHRD domain-containing protein [Chloroflexi bacterium]|nr:CHRD domain-containing protein [Chloroflexota bacterium]